jgi:peptidoglycan/LPS O-acetylase OafA/YrhL
MKISTQITQAKTTTSHSHFYELDSLRGLAALTVMLQHILQVLPVFSAPYGSPMPFLA